MLTEEQIKDVDFCKGVLTTEIGKTITHSEKLKGHIPQEVLMSLAHLRIFRDCFNKKEFADLEEAWKFFKDDMRSIIEKINYANNFLLRVEEQLKKQNAK